MNRWSTLIVIAITGLMLACGGGTDETASQAPEAAAGAAGGAAAEGAAAKTADVAAAAPEDAVKRCLALAAQQKWNEALDPCVQASQERPGDMRIKHAVQQAKAAAGS